MDDLISRQAAISEIGRWKDYLDDDMILRMQTGLKRLPAVDAVPVVRCKDCIRFRPDDDVWGWCTVSGKMRCKDFCSYGVREDGDQNG